LIGPSQKFLGHEQFPIGAPLWPPPHSANRFLYTEDGNRKSEMKFCEKYGVEMLKIIIGYTLNNFTTHITIL
jgi:hypothetical protein